MKAKEFIIENKAGDAVKPRNFVAKNAMKTTSGAGAHKDKKRAEKQGDVKHKNKFNYKQDDWSAEFERRMKNEDTVSEKAVSKQQQKFMGMVHAAKKGETPASPEVAKVAAGMSKKAAKDFAATKHKGLPKKKGVSEGDRPGMKDGRPYSDPLRRHPGNDSYMTPEYLIQKYQDELKKIAAGPYKRPKDVAMYQARIAKLQRQQGVEEGKKPEHNLGTGWMLAKDKELGKKVAQNTDKARREKEMMQKYAGKKDIEEARQSVAVKLGKAWDQQKAKSAASRERAKELLNPAKKDQEKKNG